jgi:FlaA1/EpsC-like NDP-sugar epimerase
MLVFYFFRLYEGMWKYVSISDMMRNIARQPCRHTILVAVVMSWQTELFTGFARSILTIDFFICFLAMSGQARHSPHHQESAAKAGGGKSSRTLIVGDLSHINSFLQAMSSSPSRLWIVGMLCDEGRIGRTIRGVPILGRPSSAAKCAQKHGASEMMQPAASPLQPGHHQVPP